MDGSLEGAGPGQCNPLVISEGTGVGIKLGIYDGEVPVITLVAAY